MSSTDIQNLSKKELFELIAEYKAKLLSIRVAQGFNKDFKAHEKRQYRKAIARLLTHINGGKNRAG